MADSFFPAPAAGQMATMSFFLTMSDAYGSTSAAIDRRQVCDELFGQVVGDGSLLAGWDSIELPSTPTIPNATLVAEITDRVRRFSDAYWGDADALRTAASTLSAVYVRHPDGTVTCKHGTTLQKKAHDGSFSNYVVVSQVEATISATVSVEISWEMP